MMKLHVLLATSLCLVSMPTDAQTTYWELANCPAPSVSTIVVDQDERIYVFTSPNKIYFSSTRGATWDSSATPTGFPYSIKCGAVTPNGHVFVSLKPQIDAGLIYRSTDRGYSWSQMNQSGVVYLWFEADSSGFIFAGNANLNLYRSSDGGMNWNLLSLGGYCTAMVTTPQNVLVANVSGSNKRSTDHGLSWSPPQLFTTIWKFGFDAAGMMYACGYGSGMSRSTDNGLTWTTINTGLTSLMVWCIATSSSRAVLVGTDAGIFLSTNQGDSWVSYSSGLSAGAFYTIDIDNEGFCYTACGFGGSDHRLYKTRNPVTSMFEAETISPQSFSLLQNYPNPFNPATAISFTIPHSSFITLKVFDVLGREVATLVNEEMRPGRYERILDGSAMASGVYFYRLQAGSFASTRKLLILR